jgi:hypothetical protein
MLSLVHIGSSDFDFHETSGLCLVKVEDFHQNMCRCSSRCKDLGKTGSRHFKLKFMVKFNDVFQIREFHCQFQWFFTNQVGLGQGGPPLGSVPFYKSGWARAGWTPTWIRAFFANVASSSLNSKHGLWKLISRSVSYLILLISQWDYPLQMLTWEVVAEDCSLFYKTWVESWTSTS